MTGGGSEQGCSGSFGFGPAHSKADYRCRTRMSTQSLHSIAVSGDRGKLQSTDSVGAQKYGTDHAEGIESVIRSRLLIIVVT